MQWRNSRERYGAAAQLLHWTSVLLIAFAWALGLMGDELPKGSIREFGQFVHVYAGELIALLLIARLAWRLVDRPPWPEPTALGPPFGGWADLAAKLTHFALYALIAAVVAVGVVALFARGKALPLAGVFQIASPWVKDRAFAHFVTEIHETLANGLMFLATIHAVAALVHHAIGDRTLKRMLPGLR